MEECRKKIHSLISVDDRPHLKANLRFLENIHTISLFEVALSLFEKKWNEKGSDFLDYFYENWVDTSFSNWYRGSIPLGFSHTNNAIEGFNNGIKLKYTNWERLQLGDFLKIIEEIISDYSEQTSMLPFPKSLSVSKDLWMKAQKMEKDSYFKEEETFYWHKLNGTPNNKRKKASKPIVTKYLNMKRCKSFDTLKESNCLWMIQIGDNIHFTSCSCPKFRLYHVCNAQIGSN